MTEQKWPQVVWIVRHGQSAGNVARDAAELAGHHLIDIASRDIDVPLSTLGEQQAAALGRWFAAMPSQQRPSVVLCSPYRRARDTATIVLDVGGIAADAIAFQSRRAPAGKGVRRARSADEAWHPAEVSGSRRAAGHVGKFYFRPPGGESWCDVILRLRSVLDTVTREYRNERVLIVGHQVIVTCFRYLFERLDEERILAIDRTDEVPNCGVTSYRFDPDQGRRGKLVLELVNFVAPLEDFRHAGDRRARRPGCGQAMTTRGSARESCDSMLRA